MSGFGSGSGNNRQDVPTLRPNELFEKRKQRDGARLKSQNKILEQIQTRIRTSSREGADPWILQTVPPFIIGLPKLEMEDCIVYLVYMLRSQAQEVRQTQPNLLQISWKHHEKEQILKGSPIMNAMIATKPPPPPPTPVATASSKPRGELRGQSGSRVRFAETVMAQPAPFSQNTMGKAPPRSVSEQKPPISFLDALEKGAVAEPRKSALDDFMSF